MNRPLLTLTLGLCSILALPAHAIRLTESAPAPAEHAADGAEKQIAGFIMSE
jgi:hypothetical protein